MSEPIDDSQALARLVRDLRKHRGLTLDELAGRVKRSLGFLSQVERGLSRPTVADLTAISEALQVPTTYFYQAVPPREIDWVTRPGERRTLYYAGGVTDVLVSPTLNGRFAMLESHLTPGASSGEGHLDDSSEQGGFVLEGELTLWREDHETAVTLFANDSFQLPPHSQFRYANLTERTTRVLWVFR
ncbi:MULTISPECIES: XRE family transcriptional regulator [unclassified Pseudomonas]|uniref:helix-turn-helix domain-containing protein n=1 Tax=unclassified Pseudomonas TaxID=196821 RepID=UPI00244BBDBC|nr:MULTISPECIES: XRE family transcriptional regulator [unclassified Pseudomonas]MDH0300938.1 XRE family transcriptional regulator [Pseudomonas sp. GD04091]MDH1983530.1 XRE family transcriptional regulator [Pseudomonas sp. GD03689]